MTMLRKIWNEIRHGDNIDLYLTVLTAIIIAALNILGQAPPSLLSPITLAVLALLAFAILGNRHRIERLLDQAKQSSVGLLLEKFPDSFESDFQKSTEVWIVGYTLGRTTSTYYSLFQKKLSQGKTIKVLVVDPRSVTSKIASLHLNKPINTEQYDNAILTSLHILCDLKKRFPNCLEIRTTKHYLSFGYFGFDISSSRGIIYLEHYPFKSERGDIPKMVINSKDDTWYEFFTNQIYVLWDNALEWKCSE